MCDELFDWSAQGRNVGVVFFVAFTESPTRRGFPWRHDIIALLYPLSPIPPPGFLIISATGVLVTASRIWPAGWSGWSI